MDVAEAACAICSGVVRGPKADPEAAVVVINFFGPTPLAARQGGAGGHCRQCDASFCSRHSAWVPVLSGHLYESHCPDCGHMLGALPAEHNENT